MKPDDKRTMEYRGFQAVITFDESEQRFRGDITSAPDMSSLHGATVDEVRQAFVRAVDHRHHEVTMEAFEQASQGYEEVFRELAK